MQKANVTVGIRTYNSLYYIEQCLNSVYNQSIRATIKVVLVDDYSTDDTISIINLWISNHKDFNIEIHTNNKNQGAGVMLMLLQLYINNTEYVIILDSDDFYIKNDCLEYMYNFIKKHDFDFVKFSRQLQWHHVECLIKYELYKQIKFNPFRFAEDHYEHWLQRVTNNWVLHDYEFYYYRNNQLSLTRSQEHYKEIYKVFDNIYYYNTPEASIILPFIKPEDEHINVYNEMLKTEYELHPAVLVLSKDTNLTEWINHYLKLGFEQIFILDNNDVPILYDNVTIIPYNNIPLINWLEFQSTAYDHALRFIKSTNINYLLVVDDDEYLELKDYTDIKSFIKNEMISNGYYSCDFIWETYDDNDIIYEKDVKLSIQETYTRTLTSNKFSDTSHLDWSKCLFKITPDLSYSIAVNPAHSPYNDYEHYNYINKNIAVLKHYRTLCLETFLKSKVKNKNFTKGCFGMHGLLTSYFHINICTIDKLNAFKSLCEKYNILYDVNEYNDYIELLKKHDKLSIVIPIIDECDLTCLNDIDKSYDITIVTTLDNINYPYNVIKRGHNIYDALNYTISLLRNRYCTIILPNSKLYPNKFNIQLEYLRSHPEIDILTCNCLYNGLINNKPIISTAIFKTDIYNKVPYLFEDYYNTFDKFFINCKHLNIYNINEILQEEEFEEPECIYNIYHLDDQLIMNKSISIIIPFLNEGYEVLKTVESIRATTKGLPIILINDLSTDNYDYEFIAKKYSCEYIKNSTNLGVAGSRDLGVSLCKTPYFVILDAHMRFYDLNWEQLFIKLLDLNVHRIICSNSSTIVKDHGFYNSEQKLSSITYGAFIDFDHPEEFDAKWTFKALDNDPITRVASVLGACYASSKIHWLTIGGLQGLIKYGLDEALMSIKTWLVGGECLLIKDFLVGHVYRSNQPYNVDSAHLVANRIYLANLFGICLNDVESRYLHKANKYLNLQNITKLRELFDKVRKYDLDYFLNINELALK